MNHHLKAAKITVILLTSFMALSIGSVSSKAQEGDTEQIARAIEQLIKGGGMQIFFPNDSGYDKLKPKKSNSNQPKVYNPPDYYISPAEENYRYNQAHPLPTYPFETFYPTERYPRPAN